MCLTVPNKRPNRGPHREDYKVPADIPAGYVPMRLPAKKAWKIVCYNASTKSGASVLEHSEAMGKHPEKDEATLRRLTARTTRTPYRGTRWHPKINVALATETCDRLLGEPRLDVDVGPDYTRATLKMAGKRIVGAVRDTVSIRRANWAPAAIGPDGLESVRGISGPGATIHGGAIHLFTDPPTPQDIKDARAEYSLDRGYGAPVAVEVYYLPEDVIAYGTFNTMKRPNVAVVRCYGSEEEAEKARAFVDDAVREAASKAVEALNRQMIDMPEKPAPKKPKKRVNRSKASSKKGVRRK